MTSNRVRGAVCAALIACTAVPAAAAEDAPRSPAAALWQLRSGLNVAALACRGPEEAALVASYNRLLADHKAELAAAYQATTREYRDGAAFDEAMTRLYNSYAQPGAQAALCANAGAVLAAFAIDPAAPLGPLAEAALALLDPAPAPFAPRLPDTVTQVAVASIPQILDQRALPEPAPGPAPEPGFTPEPEE